MLIVLYYEFIVIIRLSEMKSKYFHYFFPRLITTSSQTDSWSKSTYGIEFFITVLKYSNIWTNIFQTCTVNTYCTVETGSWFNITFVNERLFHLRWFFFWFFFHFVSKQNLPRIVVQSASVDESLSRQQQQPVSFTMVPGLASGSVI